MVKFSVNCFIFRARSFKTASASFVFFFSFFIQGTPLFSPYFKLSYLILWPGFFSSLKIKQSIRRLLLLFLTKWKLKESRLNFQETVDLLCVVWSPRWPTLGRYYFFFFLLSGPNFNKPVFLYQKEVEQRTNSRHWELDVGVWELEQKRTYYKKMSYHDSFFNPPVFTHAKEIPEAKQE